MVTSDPRALPFHVYPVSAEQTDLAHGPETRLVRGRHEPDCPLCQAGRCWQEVKPTTGREVIVHGTVQA